MKDKPYEEGVALADYDAIDILSEGCHLFGEILWPDGSYTAPRPCVILMHGYPGTARNDDLAQALRRCGCVVLTPHHRGAWGSEGKYLISHCVEDAVNIAHFVHSNEFCRKMNIDPECIFLGGHSMGSNSTLNAARQLPWLRGLILLTPYDPTRYFRLGQPQRFRDLLPCGLMMNCDGFDAIYQDAFDRRNEFCFENAFDAIKDQNVCCIAGSMDPIAPFEEMVEPLWNLLKAHPTRAIQRLAVYPCSHGMCNSRTQLIQFVGEYVSTVVNG